MTQEKEIKPPCPQCGNVITRKSGKFMTKRDGLKQRFQCPKCATTFY